MSLWLAFAGLVVAIIIGLGRQITVFLVVEPAIGIFRRYRAKRNIGIVLAALFCGAALVIDWQGLDGVSIPVVAMSAAAAALALFAVLFNLESLFPALDEVRVLDRQAVDAEAKAEDDLAVVHVEIDDARRSYPLERMVMARHLVHDSLGGSPIVLTYCALCRSGIVYCASVAGHELTFRVVGIFRRNLIMEDLQTRTLWQQATGRAIYGPLAGETLEIRYSRETSSLTAHRLDGRPDPIIERHWWLGWNEFHPETTVYRASE